MAKFSDLSWKKHISGMQKDHSGQGHSHSLQSKKFQSSQQTWEPNLFYLYQNDTYCIMPGGNVYIMQPLQVPSIGYSLVGTDVTKQTIMERSQSITENEALNVMFYNKGNFEEFDK